MSMAEIMDQAGGGMTKQTNIDTCRCILVSHLGDTRDWDKMRQDRGG